MELSDFQDEEGGVGYKSGSTKARRRGSVPTGLGSLSPGRSGGDEKERRRRRWVGPGVPPASAVAGAFLLAIIAGGSVLTIRQRMFMDEQLKSMAEYTSRLTTERDAAVARAARYEQAAQHAESEAEQLRSDLDRANEGAAAHASVARAQLREHVKRSKAHVEDVGGLSAPSAAVLQAEVAFNPLGATAGGGGVEHDAAVLAFGQWEGPFETQYLTDWLGVKTRYGYDCDSRHNGGYLKYIPSRRIPCKLHDERINTLQYRGKEIVKGYMPLADIEYPEYVGVLEAVQECHRAPTPRKFVIAEVGARYAAWAVRGVAAWRALSPGSEYSMLAVEPTSIRPALAHAAANYVSGAEEAMRAADRGTLKPLPSTVDARGEMGTGLVTPSLKLLKMLVNSTFDLGVVLDMEEHFDLLSIDCQGGEGAAFQGVDTVDAVTRKVHRLAVGTHSAQAHADLEALFSGLGWLKTMDYQRQPRLGDCDKTVSEPDAAFEVEADCTTDTPWGPVYVRDGLLGFVNPSLASNEAKERYALPARRSAARQGGDGKGAAEASAWVGTLLEGAEAAGLVQRGAGSNIRKELDAAEAKAASGDAADAAELEAARALVETMAQQQQQRQQQQQAPAESESQSSGAAESASGSGGGAEAVADVVHAAGEYPILPLPSDQFSCEEQLVGSPRDRSGASFASRRVAMFKYCTINWKTGCESPPCIDSGERNPLWPQPVLFSRFFYTHTMEMQVTDAFLRELDPADATSGSVVLDIGSNTGWFTQLSSSLGFRTHAIDVQPLCSRHVLTSAIANDRAGLVHVHNIGLSTVHGSSMQMLVDQCKGGLSFDVSQAGAEVEKTHRGKRIEQAMIPLVRLDDFAETELPDGPPVSLVKMDTEGSEIDILRSGMSIFREGRVRSLVVELGVRHWVENKGINLTAGAQVIEELTGLFKGVYVFKDPGLRVGIDVEPVPSGEVPSGLRPPIFRITNLKTLLVDRYKTKHDCNLYFTNDVAGTVGRQKAQWDAKLAAAAAGAKGRIPDPKLKDAAEAREVKEMARRAIEATKPAMLEEFAAPPLPPGEYFCQDMDASSAVAQGPSSKRDEAAAGGRRFAIQLKYCTINAYTCASPPCAGRPDQRTHWPTVLTADFFTQHKAEVQVGDIFFTALGRGPEVKPGVVLDVGCNTGYFTTLAAKLGYQVHSVDVQPFCASHARTNAAENGVSGLVTVHNVGLSSAEEIGGQPRRLQVSMTHCKGTYSFDPDMAGDGSRARAAVDKSGVPIRTGLVALQTLEHFVATNVASPSDPVRLLKMDTEGSEIDILRSGMSVFKARRVQYFVVEVMPHQWPLKGVSLEEGIAVLTQIKGLFDGMYALKDHNLPLRTLVFGARPDELPRDLRMPIYVVSDLAAFIKDRAEKKVNSNLFFYLEENY